MKQRVSAVLYRGSFLLCWLLHSPACMGEGLPKVTPLSVDETLGLVFIIPEEGFPWHAYQHANPEKLEQMVQTLLAAIPDPGARSGMKARNNPERLIGGYAGGIRSTLIGSKRLASGLRRECARSYRAHESVLIEIQAEKLDDREAALVRDVVGEAHAAFEAMRSAILGGNHEAMRDRLLDNGEIPDAKKYERLWPEYLKDIRLEQSVFEALAEIDAGACDYRVERHVTYRSPSVPAQGGAPVAAIRCEEMRVAFTLRNTAEIAQRFRLSSEYTLAADGSLVVLMRKINGKWYWNPFGW